MESRGLLEPCKSGPSKGNRPQSNENSITPRAHTSNGGPAFEVPLKTSGDRKDNVPQLDLEVAPGL